DPLGLAPFPTRRSSDLAVQVQEPGKGEALVVLNTPETASKVLQKPQAPGEPQVAAATPEPSAPKGGDTETAQADAPAEDAASKRSEEHTSELQSRENLV